MKSAAATTGTSVQQLPVLDLSDLDGGVEAAAEFRIKLRAATHEFGFFYLVGHGVDQDLINELLAVSERFFALPDADKMAIENLKSPHFRGYTRAASIGASRSTSRLNAQLLRLGRVFRTTSGSRVRTSGLARCPNSGR